MVAYIFDFINRVNGQNLQFWLHMDMGQTDVYENCEFAIAGAVKMWYSYISVVKKYFRRYEKSEYEEGKQEENFNCHSSSMLCCRRCSVSDICGLRAG